ncbi:MAG: hypothetical protein V5A84_04090 [Planctomycetota bacterium]
MPLVLRNERDAWRVGLNHRRYGEEESEQPRQRIFNLIRKSEVSRYVCGEADPALFDREEFQRALESSLEEGGHFHLLFHNASSKARALDNLAGRPRKVLLKAKVQWPARVRMYHVNERPGRHFATFDNVVMREEEHQPHANRACEFLESADVAQYASRVFEQKLEKEGCSEVTEEEAKAALERNGR